MVAPAAPLLALVLLIAACGSSDPKGPDDTTSGGSTSGGTTTGTSTAPTTGGETSGASSSTGDAPVCEADPNLDECAKCSNASCCAEIEACNAEPACDCMTGCVTGLNDISMCTEKCGTSTNFSPLTQCTLLNCASECT